MKTGLVPTMGALHDGHRALLRAARAECDRVVMSLFVNPTQFGPGRGLRPLPRNEAARPRDRRRGGRRRGVRPDRGGDVPRRFRDDRLGRRAGRVFEGAARPGHFDGVATVVLKLFTGCDRTLPISARRTPSSSPSCGGWCADLDVGVEIRAVPTVREPDGLALSSRNIYLVTEQRRRAPSLHRALRRPRPAAWSRARSTTWPSSTRKRSSEVAAAARRARDRRRPVRGHPPDRQHHPGGGIVKTHLTQLRRAEGRRHADRDDHGLRLPQRPHRRPGGRRPGAGRRLRRQRGARPRQATVAATMDELTMLTRAVVAGVQVGRW